MTTSLRRALICATAGLVGALGFFLAQPAADAATEPYISEIHYENIGTDVGDALEITADPGTDLSGWRVVLYDGWAASASPQMSTIANVWAVSPVPVVNDQGVSVIEYPSPSGLNNGYHQGMALVRPDGTVAEFISYGGPVFAADGPAQYTNSTSIGVIEDGGTPVGYSLQKVGGVWQPPAPSTFGLRNDGPVTPVPAPSPTATPTPESTTCGGRTPTILGTPGADRLTGTDGPDVIMGGYGSDTIEGLKGDDVICGGPGNDTIYGGAGNDTLFGEDGWDQLYGDKGNDTLNGGTGDGETDVLDGGPGKNAIID